MALVALLGALALGACGDTDTSNFTGEAAEGENVARDLGCAQCHSAVEGVNVMGPSWAGLAGSETSSASQRSSARGPRVVPMTASPRPA